MNDKRVLEHMDSSVYFRQGINMRVLLCAFTCMLISRERRRLRQD
jgi:hypothetical protein